MTVKLKDYNSIDEWWKAAQDEAIQPLLNGLKKTMREIWSRISG